LPAAEHSYFEQITEFSATPYPNFKKRTILAIKILSFNDFLQKNHCRLLTFQIVILKVQIWGKLKNHCEGKP